MSLALPAPELAAWHRFWLIWFCASFGTFLVAECYALATDQRRTLSAWVWSFEKFQPGQPVIGWTALHFGFIGLLLLVDLWLLGHFGFGWWR